MQKVKRVEGSLGKRRKCQGPLWKKATSFLLPPRETEEGEARRRRRPIRPTRAPATAVEGGKRRREARGFDSPAHLGLGRGEEAGQRRGRRPAKACVAAALEAGRRWAGRSYGLWGRQGCSSAPFIGVRGGGGRGASVAARRASWPALMAVGASCCAARRRGAVARAARSALGDTTIRAGGERGRRCCA